MAKQKLFVELIKGRTLKPKNINWNIYFNLLACLLSAPVMAHRPFGVFKGLGNYGVQSLSAGRWHICAIVDTGAIKCWGDNSYGQLGLGDTNARGNETNEMGDKLPTVNLGSHRSARFIASGFDFNCAILDNGTVKCWGYNVGGQLGLGDTSNRGSAANQMGDNLPTVDLGTNRTARSIVAGGYHACAILDDGTVKCWGANSSGELGLGNTTYRGYTSNQMGDNLPTVNLGTNRSARSLVAGIYHTCAILDNGSVKCWGSNAHGALGLGDLTDRGYTSNQMGDNLPTVDLGTNRTARSLAAGRDFTCALFDNGTTKCWGNNSSGQLGLGNTTSEPGSGANQMGDNLLTVDLGTNRSARNLVISKNYGTDSRVCALLDNGTTKCWGDNSYGQLGLGDTNNRGDNANEMGDNLPAIDIGTNLSIRFLAAGEDFNCALLTNGKLKCWGANDSGQLGLGDINYRGDGANQMGDNLSYVKLGHSKNKVSSETLKPMGDYNPDRFQQMGQDNNTNFVIGYHACVLLDNGSVKCWGDNSSGKLGIGDSTDRGGNIGDMGNNLQSVDLGTNRTARTISGRSNYTCALLDNGTVKCWGNGGSGQLGLGSTGARGDAANEMGDNLPTVDFGTNRSARSITTGQFHACAILDNGTVKCWGSNTSGQLGLGDLTDRGKIANQMGDNLPAVDLGTNRSARYLVAGSAHTCAILDNGTVKCWGDNTYGQLGLGDTNDRGDGANEMGDNLPTVDLGTNRTARHLVAGYDFNCALLDNGTVKCWGENTLGELGQGDVNHRGDGANEMGDSLIALNFGTNRSVRSIVSGAWHSCVILDNGSLKCWGAGGSGGLGLGNTIARGDGANEMGDNLSPIDLGTNRSARSIILGNSNSCVILDNESVKCWGHNLYGELGLGDLNNRGDGANEMGDNLRPIRFGR